MIHFTLESTPPATNPVPSTPGRAHPWRDVLLTWLIVRVGLSVWALLCSFAIPHSELEQRVAVWPPRAPLGAWLQRTLVAPWDRWDVEYFLKIAARGYAANDGTASFHPLYPLLGRAAGLVLGGNELLGLLVVSNLCAILFLVCLQQLAQYDLPDEVARRATLYLILLPAAFILFAPYTESLFLLCAAFSLLAARRGHWLLAGASGALAVLTRQQGIFLLLPLAWEFRQAAGGNWRGLKTRWVSALSLLLIPAALGAWVVWRAVALADVAFDWRQPRTLIYGLLISRSTEQVVMEQNFMPPWRAVWIALQHFNLTNAIDLLAGGFYLLVLLLCARRLWRLRPSYLIYCVTIIAVSFCLSTGSQWSLMGLPRHCLLAFPLVFPLSARSLQPDAKGRWTHLFVCLLGGFWLIALTMFYVFHLTWLP